MNEYRGKHAPSAPWPVASTATVPVRRSRHLQKNRRKRITVILVSFLCLFFRSGQHIRLSDVAVVICEEFLCQVIEDDLFIDLASVNALDICIK